MRRAHKTATAFAWLSGVGIIGIGARFLVAPDAAAAGFGIAPPTDRSPYLAVKGVRDIGTGLMALALLSTKQYRAVGWTMLAAAVIPASDAAIVLNNNGSAAIAYGVHGTTAAAMVATASVLLRHNNPVPPASLQSTGQHAASA